MNDFPDGAEVAIQATRPLPGPGHRFPNVGFTLTYERKVVDAETANAVKDALPHTIVGEDDVSFEVVGEADVPEPEESLIDAVGPNTAEDIAAETGITTLEEARAADDETLTSVSGVGQATVDNKIRPSTDSDESGEDGEDS